MQGGQFGSREPFGLLEQSFRGANYSAFKDMDETSFLNMRKTLPRRYHHSLPSRRAQTTFYSASDTTDEETASQASLDNDYAHPTSGTPSPMMAQETGLPPTPPTRPCEITKPSAPASPLLGHDLTSSLHPSRSDLNTPVHRSPPTPEDTPPKSRQTLQPPLPPTHLTSPSSRAESFKTAREAFSDLGSEGGSQVHLPLDSREPQGWFDGTKRLVLKGLGITREETEDDGGEMTPTKEGPGMDRLTAAAAYTVHDDVSTAEGDEEGWNPQNDADLLRNVTVRRKQPHISGTQTPRKLSSELNDIPSPLEIRRGSSLHDREGAGTQTPPSPFRERFAGEPTWSDAVNDSLYKHIREEKSKRLSAMSNTSTIVEAMVLSTPQPRRRTLRHTGKFHGNTSVSSRSPRASLESHSTESHPLRHKRRAFDHLKDVDTVPERRVVSNPEGRRLSVYGPQDAHDRPHKLHHQSRPITAYLRDSDVDMLPTNTPRSHERNELARSQQPEHGPSATASAHSPRLRHVSAPISSDRLQVTSNRLSSDRDGSFITSLTPQTLDAHNASHKFAISESPLRASGDSSGSHRALPDTELHAAAMCSDKPMLPAQLADISQHRPSMDQDSVSQASPLMTRRSFDHFTPSSPRRKSVDYRSEHALARHVHDNVTPMSASQFSDTLEVNEATAVSFYPHKNNSLLVVQQSARPTSFAQRQAALEPFCPDREHLTRVEQYKEPDVVLPAGEEKAGSETTINSLVQPAFAAVVEPATPPVKHATTSHVGSPLQNPREAPQPPAIKFIPATPAEELNRQLINIADPELDALPKPVRRLSLVQRARRYSETFVTPFFTRTGSLSRRHSERSPRHARLARAESKDETLHPFWHPRGFWDDFSDSDPGDNDDYDEPLPQGGDTSDVEPRETSGNNATRGKTTGLGIGRLMSVRMPGFRGTGGFLIGNSLGLDRHGTNKRRHHIALPPSSSPSTTTTTANPASSAPTRTPRAHPSAEALRALSSPPRSRDPLRRADDRKSRRGLSVPGFGMRLRYVGVSGLRERMERRRVGKEERERERRRERIRESIGTRVFHVGPGG
ncbi:hypothetical protein LTR50_006181 [Elasticomyces elasticus]|nr:hypothetical protein LTR50_006181 [Elasticomyces elasticus]